MMWKKTFDQDNTLTAHICKQENFIIHDELYTVSQKTKIKNPEEKNSDFLEDDEEEKEEEYWDANIMPPDTWTSEKLSSFLSTFPEHVPKLLGILQKQKNVYNCNPSFLCRFESIDGDVEVWIIGTLLYHTLQYREIYKEFTNSNRE